MDPDTLLHLFGALGDVAGAGVAAGAASLFDAAMRTIWDGALLILRTAFKLADNFSVFTVSTTEGPVSILWPMVLWIGGVLALGLFFWQIIYTVTHGGRGFIRVLVGPFQYGIALAVSVGMVAAFLVSADTLTTAILDYSLHARNFNDALNATSLTDAASDGVKAVVLGLAGLFGVVPAGLGYILEMLFREAAIYVLVATIPLAAAGLLANVTASWFWRCVRWLLAAIVMKPVLALTIVLGVAIVGGAQGLSGLLAGIGVLVISLIVPFVLFKLFAFVDPNTDAGSAFRDALSGAGLDSYGADSFAGRTGRKAWSKMSGDTEDDESGGSDQEQANTDRFDQAAAEETDEGIGSSGAAEDDTDHSGVAATGSREAATDAGREGPTADADSDAGDSAPPPPTDHGDSSEDGPDGSDGPPPEPPDGGSPLPPSGNGPKPGGGGAAADAEAEAEDAAVAL